MTLVNVTFEVDANLYNQAKDVFEKDGLSVEEAIVLFIKETVKRGTLPFPYFEEDLKL